MYKISNLFLLIILIFSFSCTSNSKREIDKVKVKTMLDESFKNKETDSFNSWLSPISASVTEIKYNADMLEIKRYKPKAFSGQWFLKIFLFILYTIIIAFSLTFATVVSKIKEDPRLKHNLDFKSGFQFNLITLFIILLIVRSCSTASSIDLKYNMLNKNVSLIVNDKAVKNPVQSINAKSAESLLQLGDETLFNNTLFLFDNYLDFKVYFFLKHVGFDKNDN